MLKQKQKELKKESSFSYKSIIEFKEENDDLIVKGYIATTHFDGEDIILKETLNAWKNEINEGIPRANKVSINHNRESHVAGVGVKGTARVEQLSDGEYGLYVDTLVDKTREDYSNTEYRINNNLLDSYSIEYVADENAIFDEAKGARILGPETVLHGWTLASQPMNENAVMIKELIKKRLNKEEITMPTEEEKKKMAEEEAKKKAEEEAKKKSEADSKNKSGEGKEKLELTKEQKELIELGKTTKEFKEKELKEQAMLKLKEDIKAELVESLKGKEVKNKMKVDNQENKEKESNEVIEYKSLFNKDSKIDIKERFKIAGRLAEKNKLFDGEIKRKSKIIGKEYKYNIVNLSTKESRKYGMEFKGLGITTNQNTDTDYLLSTAELEDIFDPIIYNALNQETVTWNVLSKEDFSNKANNQVQFRLKTAANTTAGAYTGNAVNVGNVTRIKYMTKFKKYQAGIEVDGDMIAAARGGPFSDVFSLEVADSTEDLLSVMNVALYAEVGAESAAGVIGFEYITDSAGNTTLYNVTRSAANKLAPASAANTYINGASADLSLTNLRAAKRHCLKDGSKIENLVYFTDHIQGDKVRGIYDSIQRTPPTSSRFGFDGMMAFDGIPIFEDKDCNDDDVFLVDIMAHRVGMWVPPTLEMLGKDSDSEKGFIKAYWCTYNVAPRRMVQIYGNSTT